jgi:type VI protein secretion system component Hcp
MPIYMQYEGIKGPVTGKYADWIELQTCQMGGMRNNGNAVGVVTEIVVTKYHDSSSAALFEASLSGEGKKVKIDFVKGDAPFLSLELEKTLILRYYTSGFGGDTGQDKPMLSFSLNFTKITYSTKPTAGAKDPKASKDKAWWDYLVP